MKESNRLDHAVFWPPMIIFLGLVVLSLVNEDAFATTVTTAFYWLVGNFGWLMSLLVTFGVVFFIIIMVSPWGRIRFGGKDAMPKYTTFEWFSMALCGGIAIGIIFWSVAEPMNFLMAPGEGVEAGTPAAINWAMEHVFLHWGPSSYSTYIFFAVPIALAVYNYNQRLTISSSLYFLIGDRVNGGWGKLVDCISLFAIVGGMTASMGMGTMQLSTGIQYVIPAFPINGVTWLIVALAIVAMYVLSSLTGIDRGLNWLANQNVKLYIFAMVYIIVVTVPAFIGMNWVESFGGYINNFFHMTTYAGIAGATMDGGQLSVDMFPQWWDMFYWANFLAFAPVVGVFLTRLTYGRTIREFLLANLIAPSMFCLLWMGIFGSAAIDKQINGKLDIWSVMGERGNEAATYEFFQSLPLGTLILIIFLVILIISFITMADSMTAAAAIMSTSGFKAEEGEPPAFLKVIWGVVMGLSAWVMISFAGIDGVKMISNVAGFPILPIAILATISMIKGMARAYREGDAVENKEELAIRREKMKQMAAERKAAKKDKKAAANA